jgi:hypothetical protein
MKFPIRYKLVSVACLILLPLLVFAVYYSYARIEQGKEDIKADNLVLASHVANELDDLIDASFATLRSLAKHPAVIGKESPLMTRRNSYGRGERMRLSSSFLVTQDDRIRLYSEIPREALQKPAVPEPGDNLFFFSFFRAAASGTLIC